jgi:hypothetical protein
MMQMVQMHHIMPSNADRACCRLVHDAYIIRLIRTSSGRPLMSPAPSSLPIQQPFPLEIASDGPILGTQIDGVLVAANCG